jgi:hypothetical protein
MSPGMERASSTCSRKRGKRWAWTRASRAGGRKADQLTAEKVGELKEQAQAVHGSGQLRFVAPSTLMAL